MIFLKQRYKKLFLIALTVISIFVIDQVNADTPTTNNQDYWFLNAFDNYFRQDPTASLYQTYPWSVMYYYGLTSTRSLGETLGGQFALAGEHVDSLELAYSVPKDGNFLEYLPEPLIVQFGGVLAYRNGAEDDHDAIYEADPYLMVRWTYFPWNQWLETTFGFAEGVSYATRVPGIEIHSATDDPTLIDNDGHFMNYLIFETTFALPKYQRFQVLFRIHHRSGCYGLYGVSNAGSNVFGVGVRYLF